MNVVLDLKIVMDTNVFVSGVFFNGPPYQVLIACQSGRFALVVSREILEEYRRVGEILAEDPDDDKFISCALASGSKVIVSGDRHLLKVSGYQGIEVLKPRELVNRFLE